jgi:hypothetical protein
MVSTAQYLVPPLLAVSENASEVALKLWAGNRGWC